MANYDKLKSGITVLWVRYKVGQVGAMLTHKPHSPKLFVITANTAITKGCQMALGEAADPDPRVGQKGDETKAATAPSSSTRSRGRSHSHRHHHQQEQTQSRSFVAHWFASSLGYFSCPPQAPHIN